MLDVDGQGVVSVSTVELKPEFETVVSFGYSIIQHVEAELAQRSIGLTGNPDHRVYFRLPPRFERRSPSSLTRPSGWCDGRASTRACLDYKKALASNSLTRVLT